MAKWVECSPMAWETWVQFQAESYQRLKEWYLIPPCLTLSNIRYVSRVKWINPRRGVAPFPTPRCSSYWKGSLLVALDYGRHLYLLYSIKYSYKIRIFSSQNWSLTIRCNLVLYPQHPLLEGSNASARNTVNQFEALLKEQQKILAHRVIFS